MVDAKDIEIDPESEDQALKFIVEQLRTFNFKDFIVISRDSAGYHVFKVFVIICGCISSLIYAFFAAFRKDINTNYYSELIEEN